MEIFSVNDLIDQGQYDQALQKLSNLNENNPEITTLKCLIYREMGNYKKSLRVINDLLEDDLVKLYNDDNQISIQFVNATVQKLFTKWRMGDFQDSLKQSTSLIELIISEKLDKSIEPTLASLYKITGNIYANLGEYTNTLLNHEKAITIYEKIKDEGQCASIYNNLGYTYLLMGEMKMAETFLEKSLKLKGKSKLQDYAKALSNYGIMLTQKGEYDMAHDHLRQALILQKKIENRSEIAYTLFELITLTILMDNQDEAEILLDDLRGQFEQFPHEYVSQLYELGNAIVKKSGRRFKSQIEAAQILQKIIDKQPYITHYYALAMKLLCEILLEELQIYENFEILEEINNIVSKLEKIGQKEGSSWILNEALLLKSKLFLIDNRISDAIDTLMESQKIAKEKGLTKLAYHITNVYNDLKYQLGFWEELDQRNASLKERIEQSDIIDLVHSLQSKSITYQIKETENPVMLLIINQGGIVKLKHKFGIAKGMHEHLIGGFLSAINTFFSDIFTEKNSVDRIRSKGYTILLRSTNQFLYCYIFEGQSLFAAQKLEGFVQEITGRQNIIKSLTSIADIITPSVKDPLSISPIIKKYFLRASNNL
ncbi:MAG: hypothetical protein HeimC2_38610 [Candidatus Heimdallarchaeota archaeon LC_2]|nr:MAG: hypothetical protein HeimC2_38610 [Candidatus Heimdallarchaeota archaeon LC_2]